MAPTAAMVSTYDFDNNQAVKVEEYHGGTSLKNSPDFLTGPLVWSGADFKGPEAYTVQLNQDDLVEIDNALKSFQTLGLDGDQVDQTNFPLPTVGRRLRTCVEALHTGRGFCIIRGLDASRYSIPDSVVVYLGLSSHIGEKRGLQDRKGNMLSHITDFKPWTTPAARRHTIHSQGSLPFHTDMGCDILSLQVRQAAHEGGSTYLSSAWTIFNDLLSRDPEVVKTLLTPNWPVQISGRKKSYYLVPLFTFHENKLFACCDPNRLGPHPAMADSKIPPLTDAQRLALEALSESAYRTEAQLKLQTGDILYFNNLALFHRRDAYSDDDNSSRHLVRLWLRNQTFGWAIPDSLFTLWDSAYGENKKVEARLYHLSPTADYVEPKYRTHSMAFMIDSEDSEESEESETE